MEAYEEIKLTKIASDSLEAVIFIPKCVGSRKQHLSWRATAKDAHQIYDSSAGTGRYYQVVRVIRNKVVGHANDVLSSFNMMLNLKAKIARLDFTYA